MDTAVVLMLATSTVIPLLSALLSRAHWPQELTGIITLALSGVSGFVTEWASDIDGYDWRRGVVLAMVAFAVAVGSRYGLWKNTATDRACLAFPATTPEPAPGKHAA